MQEFSQQDTAAILAQLNSAIDDHAERSKSDEYWLGYTTGMRRMLFYFHPWRDGGLPIRSALVAISIYEVEISTVMRAGNKFWDGMLKAFQEVETKAKKALKV